MKVKGESDELLSLSEYFFERRYLRPIARIGNVLKQGLGTLASKPEMQQELKQVK